MDSDSSRTPVAWRQRDMHGHRPYYVQQQPQHHGPGYAIRNHHHSMDNSHQSHSNRSHHHASPSSNQRTSSPSVLTTSSDDREEVPMVRHPVRRPNNGSILSQTIDRRRHKFAHGQSNAVQQHHHHQHHVVSNRVGNVGGGGGGGGGGGSIVSYAPEPMRAYRTATLRSTYSVPGLVMGPVSTWDGEPCPVHHHGNGNGRSSNPQMESTPSVMTAPVTIGHYHHPHHMISPPPNSMIATAKRFNSMSDLHRPPVHHGMMNGTGQIISYASETPKSLEAKLPLPHYVGTMIRAANGPVRPLTGPILVPTPLANLKNHVVSINKLMPEALAYESEAVCCKGQVIVVWLIIGVLTIGVIAGIILTVIAN
ncbi:uncharacterized protein LOC141848815 [Brevipalpus obovatus]|uniref:uncharacterized protein LOC141848815 n=1 Tax=Brevipalpus obovatus TaxID=246614 RepID=UPI003D9DD36E